MRAPVGLVTSRLSMRHDAGPRALDRADRIELVERELRSLGLAEELDLLEAEPIARELVDAVHVPAFVDWLAATSGRRPTSLEYDTHVGPDSFDVAGRASGGLWMAAERVLSGAWSSAFCLSRPPGHHAEAARAMGFCLLNHVAIVARGLRTRHGLARIAIIDWDAHHGNGTQHLFEDDPSVFYASLHQWPLYPGTGGAGERGFGDGLDTTLNVPLAVGTGNVEWLDAFERRVLPAVEAFRPDFVLISAGFDAHAEDPVSRTKLDESAFARMTSGVLEVAARLGHGRVVSLLEGGYDPGSLARSTAAHVAALLGKER
ncbi:MAG: histone deacetylase [Planctomycetota bacterium]